MYKSLGGHGIGKLTATADTEITGLCPPRRGAFTRLRSLKYRAAGTAHTLTVLKPFAQTTLSAEAAASQAVINITEDSGTTPPGAIAANDFLVVELSDGTFFLGKVSSVSTLAITLTASLPAIASAGAKVWFMGAVGDHAQSQTTLKVNPVKGSQFNGIASTLVEYEPNIQTNSQEQPLVVHSNNATAAGAIEQYVWDYTQN